MIEGVVSNKLTLEAATRILACLRDARCSASFVDLGAELDSITIVSLLDL